MTCKTNEERERVLTVYSLPSGLSVYLFIYLVSKQLPRGRELNSISLARDHLAPHALSLRPYAVRSPFSYSHVCRAQNAFNQPLIDMEISLFASLNLARSAPGSKYKVASPSDVMASISVTVFDFGWPLN